MSIFSTANSAVTSARAIVASNGYRLTTTRSIVSIVVLRHRRVVSAAARQNAAVNLRMQRLHPAVHQFRKPGVVSHFARGDAGFRQRAMRIAGRKDLDAVRDERGREFDDARLVGNADERPPNRTPLRLSVMASLFQQAVPHELFAQRAAAEPEQLPPHDSDCRRHVASH